MRRSEAGIIVGSITATGVRADEIVVPRAFDPMNLIQPVRLPQPMTRTDHF